MRHPVPIYHNPALHIDTVLDMLSFNILTAVTYLALVLLWMCTGQVALHQFVKQVTCSGNGNIGFFLSSCQCTPPYLGRRCSTCSCQNNGTCTKVNGVPACVCPDRLCGDVCQYCNGTKSATTGRCLAPCKPPHYLDATGGCCRYCDDATTCNGHGQCQSSGRCECDAYHFTPLDTLRTNDQLQCKQSCGCENQGVCKSSITGGCNCPRAFAGEHCEKACPGRCSDRGNCAINFTTRAPYCVCDRGYVGTSCQHKCPELNGVVCGSDNAVCVPPHDDYEDQGQCMCPVYGTKTMLVFSGVCNEACLHNGVFNPESVSNPGKVPRCTCTGGFAGAYCEKCKIGYSGPLCNLHCKPDMCSSRGSCINGARPPACRCQGTGNGHFNGTLESRVVGTRKQGKHARGTDVSVRIQSALAVVDADATVLSVEMRVKVGDIVVANLPCVPTSSTSECKLFNVGNSIIDSVARESDIPLAFFDPASKVGKQCNASNALGARLSCLARSVCVAYNAEANVMFDCYGPSCKGDVLPATECHASGQSAINPALDMYLAFDLLDTKPLKLTPLVAIDPTPAPTPFVTPLPTPATKTVFVSTGYANLDESEARIVCPRTCLAAPNGTAWEGSFRMPEATVQEPQPMMQCACLIAKVTDAPTSAPTPPPTPFPTPAPTPSFSLRRLLGLPLAENAHHLTGTAIPNFPTLVTLIQALETDNDAVAQPLALYVRCRRRTFATAVTLVQLYETKLFTSQSVNVVSIGASLQRVLHLNCPDLQVSQTDNRLRLISAQITASVPPINSENFRLLVRTGETVPPMPRVSMFTVDMVVRAEQGCNRCLNGYYPEPGVSDSIPACSRPCIAETTCHGNGVCSELGECVCDTTFGQVWASGTNCATCAVNFYPRPSRHDHITQRPNDVRWCTSWCNPNMDIKTIRANVMAQFVPAGFEAAVIGCSGHGQCANGLNLTMGSPDPPVRCVCDVAGNNNNKHGFRGEFCDDSCDTDAATGQICSGHGTCRTGVRCDCDDGFFGPSCEFTCRDEVYYRHTNTGKTVASKCNAENTASGGTCQASDRYVYPVTGAQVIGQTCWLGGKPDASNDDNPNGAAAAQCCGLAEDTERTDAYLRVCNDSARLDAGVFCNATSNSEPGVCLRAQCECHGSLAGKACDLAGCKFASTGTQGFSACGSAIEQGQCQHGECVLAIPLSAAKGQDASTPYEYDPSSGEVLPTSPGICSCHRQPLTTETCTNLLLAQDPTYSTQCCPGAVTDAATSGFDGGLEVFHGDACSVDCACARRATGTCSVSSDSTIPCECRKTSLNNQLFCGNECSRTCPGITLSVLQLEPFCPASVAPFNSKAVVDGCYDENHMGYFGEACNGHGACIQSGCNCQCLGFTTSTVYGAVYDSMQLYNGEACQTKCPGVTDDLVELAKRIQDTSSIAASSIQRTLDLERFVSLYQQHVCSGHGFCGTESDGVAPGCTCVGGYTGTACDTMGCSHQVSLSSSAETEIDDFGYMVCGRGTCNNNNVCECTEKDRFENNRDVPLRGTLWDGMTAAGISTKFKKFRRLLDVPCLMCTKNRYSSQFASAKAHVHAHLPEEIVALLSSSTCDLKIETSQAVCCNGPLLDDFVAIFQGKSHGGCQTCEHEFVQTGGACETCLMGFAFHQDCSLRCRRCADAASVMSMNAFDDQALGNINSFTRSKMRCTQCVGAGDNALNPEIMPKSRNTATPGRMLCSGHGTCVGAPDTWGGNSASANVALGNDLGSTTLCQCDPGYAGALCGIVTDANNCKRGGDNKATLLQGGLCVCSSYTTYGGPWCEPLDVNAALLGLDNIKPQVDANNNVVRVPPEVISVNGNIITCNGRGTYRQKTKKNKCTHGPDQLFYCKAAPGEAIPEPPCQCSDDRFDAQLNCLDFTAQAKLAAENSAREIFAV